MTNTKIYTFYNEPFYDSLNQEYFNIITINKYPDGELKKYVKTIKFNAPSVLNKLSRSHSSLYSHNCCNYGINNSFIENSVISCGNNKFNLCTLENLPELYEFLINNNYIINTQMTKLFNSNDIKINNSKKLIFVANYTT